MRVFVNFLFILLLVNCNNNAQNCCNFDKIPIDTSMWVITDTLFVNLNSDGINDVILIFDKYKALVRPNNIQAQILFYLGSNKNQFLFLDKSEKMIFSSYYDLNLFNNSIIVLTQQGMGNDRNTYINFYKYKNEEIVMFKTIVIQKIEKAKVNEETGDVITTFTRFDTIYNQTKDIPLKEYDILQFKNKFNK